MMKDALAVPSASDSRQQRPRRRRAAADNVERDGAGVMGVGTLAPTGLELRADIQRVHRCLSCGLSMLISTCKQATNPL